MNYPLDNKIVRRDTLAQQNFSSDHHRTDVRIEVSRKFVRIADVRADGFVAFDFAIGEPGIYVEMLLPRDAFETFCRDHAVTILETADAAPGEDPMAWGLRNATQAAGEGTNPGRTDPASQEMRLN